MKKLYKCDECSFAATSDIGLLSHILDEHVETPTENRIVAFPDDEGGYWIGNTYEL
jgi:hypothetical protein